MGTLLQFETLSSATVQETFTSGTTLTDLDGGVGAVPTVVITKPDGTTIASGTVTRVSVGLFQFVLAGQPDPTELTVTWTGTIGGQPQTRKGTIEIIGAQLFTVAEFRAVRVGGDTPFAETATPLFSTAQIMEARAAVLEEFATILGFAPVPRFARETVSVGYGSIVVLRNLLASRVLSVSVAGTSYPAAGYMIDEGNRLLPVSNYSVSPWTSWGYGNLTVEYQHGWARPLGEGRNHAMVVAASILIPGISSTASSVTTPDGVSYSFDAAGQVTQGGTVRHYGIPRVDAWLNRHRQAGLAVA